MIRDETAAYLDVWWRRIVAVTVFGIAFANIALLLGLYRRAYGAVVRLVMLIVHLFVVIIILQCRRSLGDAIRPSSRESGLLAVMRNRFADIWHIPAIILDLALWAVWALKVQNGYALLLRYFLASLAVLVIARLASIAVMAALDRLFRASTVQVTAGRNLNDFLVVQNTTAAGQSEADAQAITALRGEVRSSMLSSTNARLQQLAAAGGRVGAG